MSAANKSTTKLYVATPPSPRLMVTAVRPVTYTTVDEVRKSLGLPPGPKALPRLYVTR